MTKTKHKPEIEARWFTLREAGQYMGGRTPEAVRMMVRRGRLKYVAQGRRIYIDRLDIDQIMEAGKTQAT